MKNTFDKFIYLFKDEFKHPDPEIRKEAIEKSNDQKKLSQIATSDEVAEVRRLAIRKITEQQKLFEIVKNEKDLANREIALKMIKDDNILLNLVNTPIELSIKDMAVKQIKSASIIDSMLSYKDPVLVRLAVKVLTNEKLINLPNIQNILIEIVKNDKNLTDRENALRRVLDSELILHVAEHEPIESLRTIAITRITNDIIFANSAKDASIQDAIIRINKKEKNLSVRIKLTSSLMDQNVLAELAQNDPIPDIRITALKKLRDVDIILEILRSDDDYGVKKACFEKLGEMEQVNNNQLKDLLLNIARDNENYLIRMAALNLMKTKDFVKNNMVQNTLIGLLMKETNEFAKAVLVECINDLDIIKRIARSNEAYSVKKAAIEKIEDKEFLDAPDIQLFLSEIIKNDKNPVSRENALKKSKYAVNNIKSF